MLSTVLQIRKIHLVDKDTPEIFQYIKNHKIPTTILTKGRTKNYGIIPNMVEFRIKELQSLGLEFQELSPFKKEMILPSSIIPKGKKRSLKHRL